MEGGKALLEGENVHRFAVYNAIHSRLVSCHAVFVVAMCATVLGGGIFIQISSKNSLFIVHGTQLTGVFIGCCLELGDTDTTCFLLDCRHCCVATPIR